MALFDWLDPDYDSGKAKREEERYLREVQRFDDEQRRDEERRGKWCKFLAP